MIPAYIFHIPLKVMGPHNETNFLSPGFGGLGKLDKEIKLSSTVSKFETIKDRSDLTQSNSMISPVNIMACKRLSSTRL